MAGVTRRRFGALIGSAIAGFSLGGRSPVQPTTTPASLDDIEHVAFQNADVVVGDVEVNYLGDGVSEISYSVMSHRPLDMAVVSFDSMTKSNCVEVCGGRELRPGVPKRFTRKTWSDVYGGVAFVNYSVDDMRYVASHDGTRRFSL